MAVNSIQGAYHIVSEWDWIKKKRSVIKSHSCRMFYWIRELNIWVYSISPTHTRARAHTHSVAPQLCALSGCWQVAGGGISGRSSFASTALMPQTKCSIQQGFPERARGWRSDCLPDWLRSDCKTCIFVSVPPWRAAPSCHSDAPLMNTQHLMRDPEKAKGP